MRVTDWSSYDGVALRYDEVWGGRFVAAARFVGELISVAGGSRVLDIGTGTGIMLRALGDQGPRRSLLTGCDGSMGMLRVAKTRVPEARFVATDAVALPFQDRSTRSS